MDKHPPIRSTVDGESVSSELEPLIATVFQAVYCNSVDEDQIFVAIRNLLDFLCSSTGRTNANCYATDHFFGFVSEEHWPGGEERWAHLSPQTAASLGMLGDSLHDTFTAPEVANPPEAILARVLELDDLRRAQQTKESLEDINCGNANILLLQEPNETHDISTEPDNDICG